MKISHVFRSAGLGALAIISAASAQSHTTSTSVRAEFRSEPATVHAGRPATLIITVKDAMGNVVRDLQVVHEKKMHLILVSADLSEFAHVHPQQVEEGSFQIAHTFQYGGEYRLFADFTPLRGEPLVEKFSLRVDGGARPTTALVEGARSVEQDGLRFTMAIDKPLRVGEAAMLNFAVNDARTGKPVTDLQPYLGALAHFVIISQDGADFLHAHPMEKSTKTASHEHGDHEAKAHQHGANLASGSKVSAHTSFPRAGLYKLWAQFQRNGRVMTVPFVVRVENN